MLIFLGVSSIKVLRKEIASGKSRLYQCIVPLSILEKVVSTPEPIFTIVAFGCFAINCFIVSSIFRARVMYVIHPYSPNVFAIVEKSKSHSLIIRIASVSSKISLFFSLPYARPHRGISIVPCTDCKSNSLTMKHPPFNHKQYI